jgi:hypothetical protein
MHRTFLASCCLVLIACTSSSEPATKAEPAKPSKQAEPVKTEPEPAKPEPAPATEPGKLAPGSQILGLMQTTEGLTLQVESGGCRKAADVAFASTSGALIIASVAPDSCERHDVLGTEVLFSWADVPAFMTIAIELAGAEVVEPGKVAGPSVPPEGGKDEPLYGALVKPDGLDVRVSSGGCTEAEHFAFYVEPGAVQQVHIVRTKPDTCEAYVPEGELLHFTWEQLGVTAGNARVANPFEKLIVK